MACSPFPITPYADDGSVDLDAMRANAGWLRSGMQALVAPSGTGEVFSLSPEECAAIVEATVDASGGHTPAIAGVGFGPWVAADLAGRAERAGAAGILMLPPYYLHPSRTHSRRTTARSPEPRASGWRSMRATTSRCHRPQLERLGRDFPNLVAFKDGRDDVRLFQRLHEHLTDRLRAHRPVWLASAGDDLVAP